MGFASVKYGKHLRSVCYKQLLGNKFTLSRMNFFPDQVRPKIVEGGIELITGLVMRLRSPVSPRTGTGALGTRHTEHMHLCPSLKDRTACVRKVIALVW